MSKDVHRCRRLDCARYSAALDEVDMVPDRVKFWSWHAALDLQTNGELADRLQADPGYRKG
jgi:hypothetical protein